MDDSFGAGASKAAHFWAAGRLVEALPAVGINDDAGGGKEAGRIGTRLFVAVEMQMRTPR